MSGDWAGICKCDAALPGAGPPTPQALAGAAIPGLPAGSEPKPDPEPIAQGTGKSSLDWMSVSVGDGI